MKNENGNLTVRTKEGSKVFEVDCLLWAIGRAPSTANLGLKDAGEKRINTVLTRNKRFRNSIRTRNNGMLLFAKI